MDAVVLKALVVVLEKREALNGVDLPQKTVVTSHKTPGP